VRRIVAELASADYVARERRDHYTIQTYLLLPDALARGQKVGDLLRILTEPTDG
jgi:hypothetical protein